MERAKGISAPLQSATVCSDFPSCLLPRSLVSVRSPCPELPCLLLLQKSPGPHSNPCCVRLFPGSWCRDSSKCCFPVLTWLVGHAGGCWGTVWGYLSKDAALEDFVVQEQRRVARALLNREESSNSKCIVCSKKTNGGRLVKCGK